MKRLCAAILWLIVFVSIAPGQGAKGPRLDVHPKPIASAKDVKYDYDIVYVRAPRYGDEKPIAWSEVFAPLRAEPGLRCRR